MKDNITIGLYGIDGTFNYGGEAIIRGTEIILRNTFKNLDIKYLSLNPKDDKKRLKGCDVEINARKTHNKWSLGRLNNLFAYYSGFYFNKLYIEDLEWINDCDIIFSVGGDNYALPANYYENYYKKFYSQYVHFGNIVKNKNKKLVIWGASIGPFEPTKGAKSVFSKHLKSVDLILSRERNTTNYLKNCLNINENVSEFPDPAFSIPIVNEIFDVNPKLVIGINLSPLSSFYVFGQGYSNSVIENHVQIIEMLIKTFNAEILLIPHVISSQAVNDDLNYMKIIRDKISEEYVNDVKLIEEDIGFVNTKTILSSCDLVIAVRMHCAINAISVGIPTIFIAYSTKAYGMAEYVYGNEKWLINLEHLNSKNLELIVKKMLSEKDSIKKYLNIKKNYLKQRSYLAANEIKKIL